MDGGGWRLGCRTLLDVVASERIRNLEHPARYVLVGVGGVTKVRAGRGGKRRDAGEHVMVSAKDVGTWKGGPRLSIQNTTTLQRLLFTLFTSKAS